MILDHSEMFQTLTKLFKKSIRDNLGEEVSTLINQGILELIEEDVICFERQDKSPHNLDVRVRFKLKASQTVEELREENYKLKRQLEDIKTLLKK